jgi:hypothetical protein
MGRRGEDGDWLVGCTGVGAHVAAVHKGRIREGRVHVAGQGGLADSAHEQK